MSNLLKLKITLTDNIVPVYTDYFIGPAWPVLLLPSFLKYLFFSRLSFEQQSVGKPFYKSEKISPPRCVTKSSILIRYYS